MGERAAMPEALTVTVRDLDAAVDRLRATGFTAATPAGVPVTVVATAGRCCICVRPGWRRPVLHPHQTHLTPPLNTAASPPGPAPPGVADAGAGPGPVRGQKRPSAAATVPGWIPRASKL